MTLERVLHCAWIGLLAALSVGWGKQGAAAQRVYWTDVLNGKIQSANLDGSDVTTVFDASSVATTHPARPTNLVVDPDEGWVYWTDLFSGVHRVRLDGTDHQNIAQVTPVTIPEHTFPGDGGRTATTLDRVDAQGIALDRFNKVLYWGPDHPFESPWGSPYMNPPARGARIRRSNLDGTGTVDVLSNAIAGFPGPLGLDASRGHLYFSSPTTTWYPTNNGLYRVNLDGTDRITIFEDPDHIVCDPRDVEVDEAAGQVYWSCASAGAIMRANLDGTARTTLLKGLNLPNGLALDVVARKMYFTELGGGRVARMNLDGTGRQIVITESTANPRSRQLCTPNHSPNLKVPCSFAPQGVALTTQQSGADY